jgi:hypothetical protein
MGWSIPLPFFLEGDSSDGFAHRIGLQMKNFRFILIGIITGIFLAVAFLWLGSIQIATAKPAADAFLATSTPLLGSSEDQNRQSAAGSDEIPPAGLDLSAAPPSLNALPTPIPGETLVYFPTTDSDATATVLYLYNTDSVLHTVALRGYSYNGVLGYSLNINVPATSFIRLSSDSIAAAPPPSWATPAPIITNFTDFTYFASLSLPKGVKVEGFMLYNPGTGTVDPRADQGAVPLRFSTDPLSIFMPDVQSP